MYQILQNEEKLKKPGKENLSKKNKNRYAKLYLTVYRFFYYKIGGRKMYKYYLFVEGLPIKAKTFGTRKAAEAYMHEICKLNSL